MDGDQPQPTPLLSVVNKWTMTMPEELDRFLQTTESGPRGGSTSSHLRTEGSGREHLAFLVEEGGSSTCDQAELEAGVATGVSRESGLEGESQERTVLGPGVPGGFSCFSPSKSGCGRSTRANREPLTVNADICEQTLSQRLQTTLRLSLV